MITCSSAPTKIGVSGTADQLEVFKSGFCWREKPVELVGQAITTVLVLVATIRIVGAPGVGTGAMKPQNPPTTPNSPPVIMPASGWPMVPLMANTAPVLTPPPPEILNQSTANC